MSPQEKLQTLVNNWITSGDDKELIAFLESFEYRTMPYVDRNRHFLTSSKLKEFQRCPYHAKLKYVDGIETPHEPEDYFVIGQAVDDCLTLGEDDFKSRYLAVPRRTDKAQEENPGKVLLTNGQAVTIDQAVTEFRTRSFFPKTPKKHHIVWLAFGKIPCKAELDHFDHEAHRIGDVKTCSSITTFDPMNYLLQMSFYYAGIVEKFQEKVEAELYVVDKHEWSRSHKWIFRIPTLEDYQRTINQLILDWKQCEEADLWPHVDPNTFDGLKTCWQSEYWNICEHCKTDSPSFV